MTSLDTRLLAAHATGNKASLVTLYTEAANASQMDKAKGFYLTQAYVFALEINHAKTAVLRGKLIEMGRESPAE